MSVAALAATVLGAAVFGASGFAATLVATAVYAKDEPLPDGPVPGRVSVVLLASLAAGVGAVCAWRGESLASLALVDLIVAALCAVIWTDVTRGFIGDWFTLPPLAVVLAASAARGTFLTTVLAVGVATLPFAAAAFFSKGMGMGWGDVKLVALGGGLLDLRTSILLYAGASVVACAVALARRRQSEPIAFGPYLAGAIAVGMLLPPPAYA